MTPDELASLANISIKADLCGYQGTEWDSCIEDLKTLINGRYTTAFEVLSRLQNDDWQTNNVARTLINFYLEINLLASKYIDKNLVNEMER